MRATRGAFSAAWALVVPLLAGSCGYPEYGFAAADASTDVSDASGPTLPAASCPGIATGQDLASSISKLPIATPIAIDGDGGEWCNMRVFVLDASSSARREPDPLPAWAASASASVRLAWAAGADASSSALYLDVVVADPSLHVANAASPVDQGASFTLYVGAVSPLTGAYDDTSDQGATAFVMAPAQGDAPARAAVDVRGEPAHGLPTGVLFGARQVDGGYEIEAKFAWSVIAHGGASASVPTQGESVGLDLALRVRDESGSLARLVWHLDAVSSTSCPAMPLPECDDRTWATPTLGP